MEYINPIDYEYIINKYHDTSKPFDPFEQYVRHDGIFSEKTGLDGDTIIRDVLERDKEMAHLPHPIRKARALEYVLKNTRIACDSRDVFPAINSLDRPLRRLIEKWKQEVICDIIPEVENERARLEDYNISRIRPDFDHSVPYWERLFELGFSGILAESERARHSRLLTDSEEAFFESIKITYEAILVFIERLEREARSTNGSQRLADALKSIRQAPPSSFYEVLLVNYLYFIISEHMDYMQTRSLGNFDRLLYPYFKKDIENGVSEEEIRRDLAHLFLQFMAIGNYWGQPVYLGGEKENGDTQINELSYLFLDVYDKMGIYNPKIQLKVSKSTPKSFILKALDMIRRGRNSIVFVNDATIRKALEKIGVPREEARLCDVKGCYEYTPCGSIDSGILVYFNLLKPLEYALHEGSDGVTGLFAGNKSPKLEEYETFDDFYNEYKRQLSIIIERTIEVGNAYEKYLPYINPQPMLSATYPSCIQKGVDALGGGSSFNNNNMLFGFIADFADSMTNIKKYVFDKGELTLAQLRDALDCNFEGKENLRLKLYADRDKYGNNKELPDFFAKDIAEYLSRLVCGRKTSETRNGQWVIGFHVARMSYIQAAKTAASPNGRRFGEELSKNISASMGQNREGATAAILSATKIDATAFASDACLDLGLLPSAVSGDDGLMAMYGLLMTFMNRGGHAIHINVFDADTLRRAQKEPQKYSDLQIRVCGWNVLWNNIKKTEQDGFIRQAEALI